MCITVFQRNLMQVCDLELEKSMELYMCYQVSILLYELGNALDCWIINDEKKAYPSFPDRT